ncbi:MAG: hypothetical protein HGA53_00635, partial [Anaerolineaceae bacterium]|nr:hypothetical protein [Anaerolineaceae bacterium]
LPVYLNALTGRGVHLITVNDYLARRDARWMAPVYNMLGLSVGVLQMASRTENGQKAFLVDLEKTAPHEDQHQLRLVDRVEAYRADITYGTNSEFGFDYLRDNLTNRMENRVQRKHYFAIVDEVDNILIDEARTPLIISGPASDESEYYVKMCAVVRAMRPEDYEINERERQVSLTEVGEAHVEELVNQPLRDPERPEDITPEQARILGYLEQTLKAHHLYKRNKDYLVQGGKVVIVDEFTGRLMPGRRWSEGLHQAVEAKEAVKVEPENVTYATITIQNYFRMYEKLCGMTGTALTESEEFDKIYKLAVQPIPTNLEYVALLANSPLVPIDGRDEQNYKYIFYTRRDDPEKKPVFWKRKDYPDIIYRTEEAKLRAITIEILRIHIIGRPQLVGTTSVEHSERLSDRLQAEPIRRLLQCLLIRQVWLDKNNFMPERIIPELQFLNKPIGELNTGEMRQVARQVGLNVLTPDEPENLKKLLEILNLNEADAPRLVKVVQGGVQHQVLNARKHDEEAVIIARAGGFGRVTIATNMAGRGVDIKLGGDLPDEILQDLVRVLNKANYKDPYDMTNEERLTALKKIPVEDYGIYEESILGFFQYMKEMEQVRDLGGLHVVGSERHEARRIDNQLRGRAARQGDPGSSRFSLSLEDELMRLFGGAQMENLMKTLRIDDSMPIEVGLIGRLVEQAQERVEGANFDIRKHLLEYDDVLNSQRKRIYGERDKVFEKEDLAENILDILRTELQIRIPESLKDEESPWKLMAYLEEIQPSMQFDKDNIRIPSYPIRLLMEDIKSRLPGNIQTADLSVELQGVAEEALETEKYHLLNSTRQLIDKTEESYQAALDERNEALDTFFENIGETEEGALPRRPQEILEEISGLVRLPLRLSSDMLRRLPEGDKDVQDSIRQQVETTLLSIASSRMVGALERRLDETLNLKPGQQGMTSWDEISNNVLVAAETTLDKRSERLLGSQGQIAQNLETILSRYQGQEINDDVLIDCLMNMSMGQKMTIDPRSHQRGWRKVVLLTYIFRAARLLEDKPAQQVSDDILAHLENTLETLQEVWGLSEFERLSQLGVTISQLEAKTQDSFRTKLGDETFNSIASLPLQTLDEDLQAETVDLLGWNVQNEMNRQILLSIISELWVEYLTKVESLRVSIGLEAYAQRDPLVQYKAKASEMFRDLLSDIRKGVIARMFLISPRRSSGTQVDRERVDSDASDAASQQAARPAEERKKKRHRH